MALAGTVVCILTSRGPDFVHQFATNEPTGVVERVTVPERASGGCAGQGAVTWKGTGPAPGATP